VTMRPLSIKALYSLALAEGEGVGTAYEYYVKRLVLRPWLKGLGPVRRMLVAGLPERYGASLDFLQLGAELQAQVTVVDERPPALEKLRQSVARAQAQGWFAGLDWQALAVAEMAALDELATDFDLGLCSEVLQRLTGQGRAGCARRLASLCRTRALFAPNAANPAHTRVSGLTGLSLEELATLPGMKPGESGYLDLPPFPPGLIRSEEQRRQAATGRGEALAMWGLAYYARLEPLIPRALRRRQAHIVYALAPRSA
jgi:hypothetical protein